MVRAYQRQDSRIFRAEIVSFIEETPGDGFVTVCGICMPLDDVATQQGDIPSEQISEGSFV
jgi:hypothetical protein